ncbi:hypothetical protein PAECIP111802_05565 [Paenibacillus allorhizosphaerae]|uniref:Uncharacterized protein n=1 Tax=Paenibacillus allorhizosphaerae TaxID=2849866 RepID=A0ABN7TWS3_9BACL|nr:hypothetical protein PAECIP111802_05565 [Paenibacillus allorhizosphaerae]
MRRQTKRLTLLNRTWGGSMKSGVGEQASAHMPSAAFETAVRMYVPGKIALGWGG